MTELTVRDQLSILDGLTAAGVITPVSLDLSDPDMTYDQYEALGRMLGAMGRSVRWWVGDYLIFGEATFGEKMAQAAHATGLSDGTLLNYRWVCEQVTKSRRRLDVSFSCHQEVAPLPPKDQRKWLAVAAREQLTQRELRQKIKASEDGESAAAGESSGAAEESGGAATGTVGAGTVAANPELAQVAFNIWKHAQPNGTGDYLVPGEFMARLGALIGGEE